jgi:hypothetical protein
MEVPYTMPKRKKKKGKNHLLLPGIKPQCSKLENFTDAFKCFDQE